MFNFMTLCARAPLPAGSGEFFAPRGHRLNYLVRAGIAFGFASVPVRLLHRYGCDEAAGLGDRRP